MFAPQTVLSYVQMLDRWVYYLTKNHTTTAEACIVALLALMQEESSKPHTKAQTLLTCVSSDFPGVRAKIIGHFTSEAASHSMTDHQNYGVG